MKFPFTITCGIEAEIESIAPDGHGNVEVTLLADGRRAKVCYDAEGNNHGTLQDALFSLLGYRRDEARQEPCQSALHLTAEPQRVM